MTQDNKIAAVFCNDLQIDKWQYEILSDLSESYKFHIFNCINTKTKKNVIKHFLYYLLNVVSIKNHLSQSIPIKITGVKFESRFDFSTDYDGAWQKLPTQIIDVIADTGAEFVLKFGLGLLRIPDQSLFPVPILSFHHGDPSNYRGRPAGFYETQQGTQVVGQIVQILSNTLDGGRILAFGETKVHLHSYRQTIVEALSHSPALMKQALRNLGSGVALDHCVGGKNYRLPGNITTLAFCTKLLGNKIKRIAYGLFVEKKWQVSFNDAPDANMLNLVSSQTAILTWRAIPTPSGYNFLADPFILPDGSILAEALRSGTGVGDIVRVIPDQSPKFEPKDEMQTLLKSEMRHHSYPSWFRYESKIYVVPETSDSTDLAAYLFFSDAENALSSREAIPIMIEGDRRVIDPTITQVGSHWYLFGNLTSQPHCLRLWTAPGPFGPYVDHPCSPILTSPRGARMGGAIFEQGGDYYRWGQDNSGSYGNGLLLFRISKMDCSDFSETLVGALKFDDRKGPHTCNQVGERFVLDWYEEKISLGAGTRRILPKVYAFAGGVKARLT